MKQNIGCASSFSGPKNQGLTDAIAYFIEFNEDYATKMLNANLSNPAEKLALINDPIYSTYSNLYNSFNSFYLKSIYNSGH